MFRTLSILSNPSCLSRTVSISCRSAFIPAQLHARNLCYKGDSPTLNKFCPRTGTPVKRDALARYKEELVGFCSPECRDDFEHPASNDLSHARRERDEMYFDTLIKEKEAQVGLATS